jgi:Leucine-rich repeat (LRR) protein
MQIDSLDNGQIDCNSLGQNAYKNISYNCTCIFNSESNTLSIECLSFDDMNCYIFPNIELQSISVNRAFTKWPKIPNLFKLLSKLEMFNNKIDSIGELMNLLNLQYLNLSSNSIEYISPTLCLLDNLVSLDLSYNKIEFVNFKTFVCFKNYQAKISNLEYLYLQGNRITNLFSFENFLFSMVLVKEFNISFNKISRIENNNLTTFSDEIVNRMFKNSKYNADINMSSLVNDFSHNSIKRIHLDLVHILNELKKNYKLRKMIILKFSSFIFNLKMWIIRIASHQKHRNKISKSTPKDRTNLQPKI